MAITKTTVLTQHQANQLNELWNNEYPLTLANRFNILLDGVDHYMHYIIQDSNQTVMAWAVVFEKEQQMRFSIIVSDTHKNKGLGTLLINALKQDYTEFYGWVIDHDHAIKSNGSYYQSPMPFYIKQGFEILTDIRINTNMLQAVLIKWKQ